MKLSRKMYLGFSLVIVLAVIQGLIAGRAMMSLKTKVDHMANEYTPVVILANNIRYEVAMAGYFMRGYFVSLNPKDYQDGIEHLKRMNILFGELQDLNKRQTQLATLNSIISKIEPNMLKYVKICADIDVLIQKEKAARTEIADAFIAFNAAKEQMFSNFSEDLDRETATYQADLSRETADQVIRRHKRIMLLNDIEQQATKLSSQIWNAIVMSNNDAFGNMLKEAQKLSAMADAFLRDTRQQKNIPAAQTLFDSAKIFNNDVQSLYTVMPEKAKLGAERLAAFRALLNLTGELSDMGNQGIREAAGAMVDGISSGVSNDLLFVAIAMILLVVMSLITSVWIVRSISSEIEKVSSHLEKAAVRLNGDAVDIIDACDHLNSMSEQQASSLQSTSSALEQVTSMARQNADNVKCTNDEASHVVSQIEEGSGAVSDMTQAMSEIEDSAGKINSIIKTIEQIAFQTNLLALNAAVEAARAGEAGKGFAVVADEVRSLAQRSAQAAQETTTLIHGTVERVRRGTQISQRLNGMFQRIETSAQNVGTLVNEITSAINEQNSGVAQISTAILQIDSATQQNTESVEKVIMNTRNIRTESENIMAANADLQRLVYGSGADFSSQTTGMPPEQEEEEEIYLPAPASPRKMIA